MKVLSQSEVKQVSGGKSLIDAIHEYEWKTYGKPLVNGGILAWNLVFPNNKIAYLK